MEPKTKSECLWIWFATILTILYRAEWADEWFRTLQAVVHPVIDANRKDNQRRVRVAILDTGVDGTHPEIQLALEKKKIVAYRGFPDYLDPLRDRNGHGTHGASVLLKTAPNAAIYVARMFDNKGKMSHDAETVRVDPH